MRYLVMSDTHGSIREASQVIEHWKGMIDGVLHLGDKARDFEDLEALYALPLKLSFAGVIGNCDLFNFNGSVPHRRLFNVEGRRVLMCHGHQYHVNSGIGFIESIARQEEADIVLFGHTHVPFYKEEKGILYLNPGSLTSPRGGSQKSYALLEIENGKAAASLIHF